MKKPLPIYVTLAFLSISHFLVDFMIGIWPVYKTMAHLDLALAGLVSGASAFIGEGAQIFFGPLCDKGYRNHLILGGVLITCATTLLAYVGGYPIFFCLFMLTCLGSGAFHPSAIGFAGTLTTHHKALFISIFAAAGGLGLATSQLVFSQVYQSTDGQTIFLAIPSLCLISIMLFCGFMKQKQSSATTDQEFNIKKLFGYFYEKKLRSLYIIQVCNQSIFWALIFLLPDFLLSRGHLDWICLGGGHLCFILGASAMMIPAGYLADKYSPKAVILFATLIGLGSLYTFLFMHSLTPLLVLSFAFILGGTLGIVSPSAIAYGNELKPNNPGMVSAFLMGMSWCVSEGVGQLGGGLLTKLFTEDAAANSLAILGGLFFLQIWAVSLLPNRHSLMQQEIKDLA